MRDTDTTVFPLRHIQATKAEIVSVKMAKEALSGLAGHRLVNAVYTLLCDHPEITTEQLEDLSNRLGREAHERSRG